MEGFSPADQTLGNETNFNFNDDDIVNFMLGLEKPEEQTGQSNALSQTDDNTTSAPATPYTLPPSPQSQQTDTETVGIFAGLSQTSSLSMGEDFVNINEVLELAPQPAVDVPVMVSSSVPSPLAVKQEIPAAEDFVMEVDPNELEWMNNTLSGNMDPESLVAGTDQSLNADDVEALYASIAPQNHVSSTTRSARTRSALNPGESTEISDDDLVSLSVRDLNRRLQGIERGEVTRLKARRRTLKNRGYAHNCRSKRLVVREELETENSQLKSIVQHLRRELSSVSRERDQYRSQLRSRSSASSSLSSPDSPAFF